MKFTQETKSFIKAQINIERYTKKCIELFEVYIEKYEQTEEEKTRSIQKK